jgi:hypothetical protein
VVDRWDLFVELIRSRLEVKKLWSTLGLDVPPAGAWDKAQALHWKQLTSSLQTTIANVTGMLTNDNTKTATEGQLLACLADKEEFMWDDLPLAARDWLSMQRFDAQKWEGLLQKLQREALVWL